MLAFAISLKDPRIHAVWNLNDMERPWTAAHVEIVMDNHVRCLQPQWTSDCSFMSNCRWGLPYWAQSTNRNVRNNNKLLFLRHQVLGWCCHTAKDLTCMSKALLFYYSFYLHCMTISLFFFWFNSHMCFAFILSSC